MANALAAMFRRLSPPRRMVLRQQPTMTDRSGFAHLPLFRWAFVVGSAELIVVACWTRRRASVPRRGSAQATRQREDGGARCLQTRRSKPRNEQPDVASQHHPLAIDGVIASLKGRNHREKRSVSDSGSAQTVRQMAPTSPRCHDPAGYLVTGP
jgi:hypothetical protein